MSDKLQTRAQILQEAQKVNLYDALIVQLNKDFNLSGLSNLKISATVNPETLQVELYHILEHLVNNDFESFLALLYRIDLHENKIKNLPKADFPDFINQVTFLVLQREWMKVWYKHKYS